MVMVEGTSYIGNVVVEVSVAIWTARERGRLVRVEVVKVGERSLKRVQKVGSIVESMD